MEFRLLRADEIDCRISTCNQWGVGLLLYKDARCDMNILDETVGAMNWQRDHKELKGNIYCGVSIYDEKKQMWITKWDCGKESFTEAEKGESSDSFKRACFNVGIGRELYTAPNMFVRADDLKILKASANGRWECKDAFKVTEIEYIDRKIVYVKILNLKTNHEIEFGMPAKEKKVQDITEKAYIDETKVKALYARCMSEGVDTYKINKLYKVEKFSDLTERQFANINANWEKIKNA
jgi:hypothetical protein